jgi:predicted nucleic acid-binding protein
MLYAETSAVLRWLLGQEHAEPVRLELERAERVAASQLTPLECRRVLARLTPELDARSNATLRQMLFDAVRGWVLVELDQPVRDRAGEPFPLEPVRALDAIHLATCLELERAFGPITVLSVDQRVRDNALRLGLRVVPEALAPVAAP